MGQAGIDLFNPVNTWGILLTLMLLVANLAITKVCKKNDKCLKPWHMGTHLRLIRKRYPMNTNTTGFKWFLIFLTHIYQQILGEDIVWIYAIFEEVRTLTNLFVICY